jgi:hypothetical protein
MKIARCFDPCGAEVRYVVTRGHRYGMCTISYHGGNNRLST